MKKVLLLTITIVFMATLAQASPFLTCDCTPAADKITSFALQFVTPTWIDTPAVSTCGNEPACPTDSKRICYDLGTLPNGPFTVKAVAKNIWGQSNDSLPLSDTKSLPTSPLLLKIVK